MGATLATLPPMQGPGFPTVNMPPLLQPRVQEGEELLFGIRHELPSYMQVAPAGMYEEYMMDVEDAMQAPQQTPQQPHLAIHGPPPLPIGYEAHSLGSQVPGHLMAAQSVLFGMVFPYPEEAAQQVGTQKMNNTGMKPPK